MKITTKIWQDGHGRYRAVVRELPGCIAIGDTYHQVRQRIHLAVRAYVDSMHASTPVDLTHELVEQAV